MCVRRLLLTIAVIGCFVAPLAAASAQDQRVDIRKLPCAELDKAEDGDRIAAIFFFYGFHAALLSAFEVSPANLEKNVRNIVAFCGENPGMPIFEAVPKAFQR